MILILILNSVRHLAILSAALSCVHAHQRANEVMRANQHTGLSLHRSDYSGSRVILMTFINKAK